MCLRARQGLRPVEQDQKMALPAHKTRLIGAIGQTSEFPEALGRMIRAGMNVAWLNFSHGDFAGHESVIEKVRAAATGHLARCLVGPDTPSCRWV